MTLGDRSYNIGTRLFYLRMGWYQFLDLNDTRQSYYESMIGPKGRKCNYKYTFIYILVCGIVRHLMAL